jgi:hypothetical protein
MCSAQPQPSLSKQRQTRQRSNSDAVLPRARDRSAYGELSVRLEVKVPTPVLHRLAEKQLFDVQAIPSVHNFYFCGFGVRPGRDNRKAAVVMTI